MWDKYVLGKEPKLVITVNSIVVLNNTENIISLNTEKRIQFLDRFVEIGVILQWHNNKEPLKGNIQDKITDKMQELLKKSIYQKKFKMKHKKCMI